MIILKESEFLVLVGDFSRAWYMLTSDKLYKVMPPIYYVKRGDSFLQILHSENPDLMKEVKFDSSIYLNHLEDRIELKAKNSGYLVQNLKKKIKIFDPFVLNEDKSEGAFAFVPVVFGEDDLINDFFRILDSSNRDLVPGEIANVQRSYISSILKVTVVKKVVIQRGTVVQPAKKGIIKWFFSHTEVPSRIDEQQQVDYKSLTCYHGIKKGEPIAELTLPVAGKAGMDIFGEPIPVGRVKELSLEVGNNINDEIFEADGREVVKYSAKEDGALTLKYGAISVDKELLIHGNVSVKSESVVVNGDITIIIDGDIDSGYEVSTGGSVTVKGAINPGAKLSCGKDLTIKHGLFGKRTEVLCEGDAQIGFIQDSGLVVKGDLLVNKYVYNSDVYCSGKINVTGVGHHEQQRGVVIGGMLNAFDSIEIHSAGSDAVFTNIQCGVNMLKKDSLDKMSLAYRIVLKKIMQVENDIGINLQDENIVNIIKSYSVERQASIKENLDFLKKLKIKQREISDKIEEYKWLVYNEELGKLSIKVNSFVLPTTVIKMGKFLKKVDTKLLGPMFKLVGGQIEISYQQDLSC